MRRRFVLAIAIAALVGCGGGAKTPTEPGSPSSPVRYFAIGASDAVGYGGSVVCLPFLSCNDGTGYVQTLARQLRAAGRTVDLDNLGVPGAVLSPAIQAIGNQLGRNIIANFLDFELPQVSSSATLVTVFAGANDANTIGSAMRAGLGGSDLDAYAASQIQSFGRDFRTLISGLRTRAPNARILVLNLPNLAALPYVAGYTLEERRRLQQLAVGFSAEINATTSLGALVIDLMCETRVYESSFYSSDGFHPNDSGYAFVAARLFEFALSGTPPAPRASCPQMTLF